jgi:hypothetical protein
MSLTWAPQLIAMLYEPHGVVVAPLLVRLAREYPQALYFPFHVSRGALERDDGVRGDSTRREALREMGGSLQSVEIERLVAGFADTHNPNLRMSDTLKEIVGLLSEGRAEEAAGVYVSERTSWMVPRKHGAGRGRATEERGTLYEEFGKEHLPTLDAICGTDGKALRCDRDRQLHATPGRGCGRRVRRGSSVWRGTACRSHDRACDAPSYGRACDVCN